MPMTPERNLLLEPTTVPVPEFKLGNKSKFKFPAQDIDSPSKSNGELVELEEICTKPLLTTHVSFRSDSNEVNNAELSERFNDDSEDTSTSSVTSSISEYGSTSPSSSPVLDHAFFEKGLNVGMEKCTFESILCPVFPLTSQVKRTFKPNKNLRPFKSILKKSRGLNYIMTSLTGDFRDATIFATEVNSYPSEKVIYPSSSLERVTIPVNSEIKSKYKCDRNKILDGYHEDDDTDSNSFDNCYFNNEKEEMDADCDAAIIRAYNFEYKRPAEYSTGLEVVQDNGIYSGAGLLGTQSLRDYEKKVRWCHFLEW